MMTVDISGCPLSVLESDGEESRRCGRTGQKTDDEVKENGEQLIPGTARYMS